MNNGVYMDKINYGISAGAITSFSWLPLLKQASEIAALGLPIVGLVWLVIQIVYKVKTRNR